MKSLRSYLLLIALCLALYVPGLSAIPIVDRDEPHFAQTSKQLLETGSYFQLKFQDESRHLKPPGIYWLHGLSASALSSAEAKQVWPYRLPSMLGAILAVLVSFRLGLSLVGERAALLGSALLASSLLLVVEAHLVSTDAMLLLAVVLMQLALAKIYFLAKREQLVSWQWPLLFWSAMAFGVLIKGLAPLFAFTTIVGLLVLDKDRYWLKGLGCKWGLLLLLLLSLTWLIPLSLQSHSNFLWDMIRLDIVPKLKGGQQSHGQPPGYFLISSLITLWPASLFLVIALVYGWRYRAQRAIKFLLAWVIPAWLIYECVPTKLPEYLMPVYPALCLLMGAAITTSTFTLNAWLKKSYASLWLILSLVLAALIVWAPLYLEHQISIVAIAIASVIVLGSALAGLMHYRNLNLGAAKSVVIMALCALPLLLQWVLPNLNHLWLTRAIAQNQTLISSISAAKPLLIVDYAEPSLVFSIGTHQVKFVDTEQALQSLAAGSNWVLINQQQQAQFEELLQEKHISMHPIATYNGYRYNGGKWVNLILYQRIWLC